MRAAILTLLLSGCATVETGRDECGYAWRKDGEEIPEARQKVTVTNDVYLLCNFEEHAQACSRRFTADDGKLSCLIILPDEDGATKCTSREMLLRHEQLHCRGWVHGRGL